MCQFGPSRFLFSHTATAAPAAPAVTAATAATSRRHRRKVVLLPGHHLPCFSTSIRGPCPPLVVPPMLVAPQPQSRVLARALPSSSSSPHERAPSPSHPRVVITAATAATAPSAGPAAASRRHRRKVGVARAKESDKAANGARANVASRRMPLVSLLLDSSGPPPFPSPDDGKRRWCFSLVSTSLPILHHPPRLLLRTRHPPLILLLFLLLPSFVLLLVLLFPSPRLSCRCLPLPGRLESIVPGSSTLKSNCLPTLPLLVHIVFVVVSLGGTG